MWCGTACNYTNGTCPICDAYGTSNACLSTNISCLWCTFACRSGMCCNPNASQSNCMSTPGCAWCVDTCISETTPCYACYKSPMRSKCTSVLCRWCAYRCESILLPCTKCTLFTSNATCLAAMCKWCGNTCINTYSHCPSNTCSIHATALTCVNASCLWCNTSCINNNTPCSTSSDALNISIVSFAPTFGPVGSIVTFTGDDFRTTLYCSFNSVNGSIISANFGQLQVMVNNGTTTGASNIVIGVGNMDGIDFNCASRVAMLSSPINN